MPGALHLVAFIAIFFDGEGCSPFVALSAGASFFHLFHGRFGAFPLRRDEEGRVALVAFEHAGVDLMTEVNVTGIGDGKGHGLGRMAIGTVSFDRKSLGPVMTRAA